MSSDNDRTGGATPPKTIGWRALDIVVALWCLLVGIVFYGGYLDPVDIGLQTGTATMAYLAMLALTVVVVGLRYLRGRQGRSHEASVTCPPDVRGATGKASGRSGDTGFDR